MGTVAAASLTAVAVAVAVAGCGAQTSGASSAPPALLLVDNGAPAMGAPAVAGGGVGGFVLRTTLPSTPPAPRPVYRLPAVTRADAVIVARALDVTSGPAAVHGGWAVRDGKHLLAVRKDGSWSYGSDCNPGQPITAESLDVMCASAATGTAVAATPVAAGRGVSPPRPLPTPAAPGPSAERTRALAMPVLRRLGVAASTTDVMVGGGASTFTADATVDGLAVPDAVTSLTFDADGRWLSGNGWVGALKRGRVYPLIDATRAFRMLRDQPRPMPLLCRPLPGTGHGCGPWAPTVIVGATLGLALRHETDRPILVPAWLFSVKDSRWPIPVVAVAPRYQLGPSSTVAPPRPLPPRKTTVIAPATPPPSSAGTAGTAGSSVRG